jgi:sulfonate transport system permease protein
MSEISTEAATAPIQLLADPTLDRAPRLDRTVPKWVSGGLGILALLVIWELLALFVLEGKHIMPTPVAVVRGFWDFRSLIQQNTGITMAEALQGYLWGNVLAIILALLFVLVPPIEAALLRLAIASYCIPIIAIAPILNIVFSGDRPKIVLAAMSVFFTTLVGMVAGLRSADQANLDLVRAYGGGSVRALWKVRVRGALPSLFAALRIAAPAAVLGAIVGEYLGGDRGVGVAMINSQQSLDVSKTWVLATWAAILAGAGYGLTSVVAKLVTPWAKNLKLNPAAVVSPAAGHGRVYRTARSIGFFSISVAVALGLWAAFIKGFHLNTYFAKSPLAVWHYLFSGSAAGANRTVLIHTLGTTLKDAAYGYVAGTIAAVLLAIGCVLTPAFETTFMPIALALRSIPLVAMTPLIALAFGRGLVSVTLISGIVTFFPTFVNMVFGLRSAPEESILLMRAFDASAMTTMLKVRLPSALPALFSSARIAAPGALLGAVLAEWLATGKGLGYLMLEASSTSQFSQLWAGVVLITVTSVAIYALVSVVEVPVMRRFGSRA